MIKIYPKTGILKALGIGLTAGTLMTTPISGKAQTASIKELSGDKFEKTEIQVPPSGTSEKSILVGAPNPHVYIAGERKTAAIVVDISKNILYHYNEDGDAIAAYSIASGKKATPTHTGIRIVSHIETFPYNTAPAGTKRRRNPRDYGPKIIILDKLDPETGERSDYGEFIHGNNNAASIGTYASKGCMRMDNEVIKYLSSQVKRGDIVIVKR